MNQDATWYGGRPRPRRHCVRWGPSSPPKKKWRHSPQLSAHVYCGQTAGWIKMPLGMEIGLGPGDFRFHGDPAPPKGEHSPSLFDHVYCGQTAGWIKMPLCMEVGLVPGHIVLDGDPAPQKKEGGTTPQFLVSHVCSCQTVAHISYC